MLSVLKHPNRILHVVPSLGAGGTERNCAHLAGELVASEGFENYIVAARLGDGSFENTLEKLSVDKVQVLPSRRLSRLRAFRRHVRQVEADAIVFHFLNIDQALMAWVARRAGIRCLLAAAGNPAPDNGPELRKLKTTIMLNRLVRCPIISASNWIDFSLSRASKLPWGSCVVYNGVDLKEFNSLQKSHEFVERTQDKITLGMVARLDKIKDHSTLFSGLQLLARQLPALKFELRLVGDGPLRSQLETISEGLGLGDHIHFLGTRNDVREQLAELDVFVFSTTQKEGFGNVLIEALAAGVPIIASDVPSSREVLRGGEFGTLLQSNDAKGWADALSTFWHHGPAVKQPDASTITAAFGIDQFREGYLNVLTRQQLNVPP
jgi:glycosyltransferase involved in cell wall biosynthesis